MLSTTFFTFLQVFLQLPAVSFRWQLDYISTLWVSCQYLFNLFLRFFWRILYTCNTGRQAPQTNFAAVSFAGPEFIRCWLFAASEPKQTTPWYACKTETENPRQLVKIVWGLSALSNSRRRYPAGVFGNISFTVLQKERELLSCPCQLLFPLRFQVSESVERQCRRL